MAPITRKLATISEACPSASTARGQSPISKAFKPSVPTIDKSQWFDPRKIPATPPKPWNEWKLSTDFEIGKRLGEGSFGHVYLARTVSTKFYVALKVIHAKKVEQDKSEHLVNRETEIHIDLEHPNILKMYGYFRDADKIVYVLEYAFGGDVYSELFRQPCKRFSDQKAATYIFQITQALEYLHGKNIIHRDIKPENILIGCRGEIKLADFGWSIKTAGQLVHRRKTFCGTLDYLPPEMVNKQEYNEKVDLWCLGVLAYEFLVGKPPFETGHKLTTCGKIARGFIYFPYYIHMDARNLIQQLCNRMPNLRPSLEAARSHPWITKNYVPDTGDKLLPMFESLRPHLPALRKRYEEAARLHEKVLEDSDPVPEPEHS